MPVKIHNNDYYTVDERVAYFREHYPTGQIMTEILSHEDGVIVMRADAYVEGKLVATGHAQEDRSMGKINGTSYVENCETSCIGRCLGFMNIGANGSIASADEVALAKEQQQVLDEQTTKRVNELRDKYLAELEETVSMQDAEAYKEVWKEVKDLKKEFVGRVHSYIKENQSDEMKAFHKQILDDAQAKTEGRVTTPPDDGKDGM